MSEVKFAQCKRCGTDFECKPGKKYCSDDCRKRDAWNRHDAKRIPVQEEKARKWKAFNPTYDRDRMRRNRELYGRSDNRLVDDIENSMIPMSFESEGCIVAGDWHIPAYHTGLFSWLLDVQEETGIKDIALPGDIMDADAYSRWPKLGKKGESFKTELEQTGMILDILANAFENVYICRGNHEKRYIDQNNGNIDMIELFDMCHIRENVHVTNDTFMNMTLPDGTEWMFCHPRQFRQTPLTLARDLVAKYQKNVVAAHGHFFNQGFDKSGRFYALDGGGMFDPKCLGYLRDIYTTPWVSNGFYLIDESGYIPYSLGTEKDD